MRRSLDGQLHPGQQQDQAKRMQSSRTGPPMQYDEFSKAQKLLNLSFHDRNTINEEIHGVTCMAPEESQEILDAALYSLSLEIDEIEDKPAYNQAQDMHRASGGVGGQFPYVNTDAFRLRFLRCELFDTKKAAARLVKYLDVVSEAYGPYALTRPILLSDLSREEMIFLRSGCYQLLPYRDRSGRRIMCIVTNNSNDVSERTRLKILIYVWVTAAEDVESQRKGMVAIGYSGPKITNGEVGNNVKQQNFFMSRVTTHAVVVGAVPMRIAAIHLCLPDMFPILTKIYSMALGKWSARAKFHLGKSIELRYQLKGYGIPVELIPSTDTGNVKHVNLKQWINLREFREKYSSSSMTGSHADSDDAMDIEQTSRSSMPQVYLPKLQQNQQIQFLNQHQIQQQQKKLTMIIECPGSNDVIFRRGKSMTYHPGNVMFQSLIESRLEEHDNANQAGKLSVVLSLIEYIQHEKGGRFLTWDAKNNWWLDMMSIPMSGTHQNASGFFQAQELEIQSKVGYAFRDFKKKLKTQHALQISRSSTYAFKRQDGVPKKRIKGSTKLSSCTDGCFFSGSDSDYVSGGGE